MAMATRAAVVGAGSWGTAIAALLGSRGIDVALHCHREEVAQEINRDHRNGAYFPETLPVNVRATADLAAALGDAEFDSPVVYLVVPTKYVEALVLEHRDLLADWSQRGGRLCNCSKGLLLNPVRRVDEWLAAVLPEAGLAQLSGPNLAAEIMLGNPAASVVSGYPDTTAAVQSQLSGDRFRVYTGTDIAGAEVAGFYKNIIAIAAGIVHGLGLGDNTRAALITRGLAEMTRLAEYFGGEAATLYGLAGVGDLIVTCGSTLSRNFRAGTMRAAGMQLGEIVDSLSSPGGGKNVAEGIQASRALHEWPAELSSSGRLAEPWPELPIAHEVYRIMHEEADPAEAIARLMTRPPRAEA